MNSYIVKQSVIGLQEALEEKIKTTKSLNARNFLKEILKLSESEQEKWFLTSNQATKLTREKFEQQTNEKREICTIIMTICAVITTSIMVWNEIEKRWEKKEVEEEVCKDKEVEVENDDNSDDSDIPK
ncbi:hypothetical protein GM661_05730 [Iocasia frigidifontis]|uniref:Uncharacterized protein n=1 Tax=Iocasia fonsfrigidae TaxID=2682810 RepID=A0A8A7KD29_9FIRM|nr:hypothetical protein [Iocasia fonsfrigidae]QTL97518.1 hypothetical protein GM661_05730 [Iocasia fonsfrigidae]